LGSAFTFSFFSDFFSTAAGFATFFSTAAGFATGAATGDSPASSNPARTSADPKPVAVTRICLGLMSKSAKFAAEKNDGRSSCTAVFGVGPWKKK